MEGAYYDLLFKWTGEIVHNDKNDANAKRYAIGRRRWLFLKKNAQPFAYETREDGEQVVAFLVECDSKLSGDMPPDTKYEYLCGSIKGNEYVIFAYIWFSSLEDAKSYALEKNMKIKGGW